MIRKSLGGLLVLFLLVIAGPVPGRAASHQIEDPATDHPVPFMDLTGIGLAVVQGKGGPALQVAFSLAGAVSPESRAAQTGYSFVSKVGKCDLLVRFVGYPDGAFDAAGFATAKCGETGRDVGGTFKISDNTVTVVAALRDLKGVAVGETMTDLRAFTSPGEGMYHDDTTAPSAAGDAASSDKPWVIR